MSSTGEYTLALTNTTTGESKTQKLPRKSDAEELRNWARMNGYHAFVFDPFGHLA